MADAYQISDRLRRLAALIRPPLLGEAPAPFAIDAALARFAIHRHRVGPLLAAAAGIAANGPDSDTAALLERTLHKNALLQMAAEWQIRNIGDKFEAVGIPWLAFKGLSLARQLYRESVWRQSHDIDILVAPQSFPQAARLLRDEGFAIVNTQLPPDHWIERMIARLAKDIMLRDGKSGPAVELHRRLFFAREVEPRVPLLRAAFQPRLRQDKTDIPAPPLGAGLALYLLLHGASCRWFRLKWLADLLPLFAKLDPAALIALADAAEDSNCAVTVKAALVLCGLVFGEIPLGPIAPWLAETAGAHRVEIRTREFLRALDDADARESRKNGDRFDALTMYYTMMDGTGYRGAVLLRGGAWVALRTAGRLWPRPA
jgi:hypothetical protein